MPLLKKKNILITSGSTRGYLDAIRYITNTSTGKLGREIAHVAMSRGAIVTYVYGADSLFPLVQDLKDINPSQLKLIEIETNDDLVKVIKEKLKRKKFDAIVHAMAVADYVPARVKPDKTPSKKKEWLLKLVKTPKVIAIIRDIWPDAQLVGFKLEVNRTKDDLIKTARRFLKKNRADIIVANDNKNISCNRHIAYMVTEDSKISRPLKTKSDIAENIISYLENILN
ncbi:phosphopantothenate/cysteine ligase [Candidatus Scalindua japonica]|uniref:Phosphopantothenate/cysteine ligase n=1 Tax=Candidatus Scalindua japonica TaxID=1284222 RepID=A0A286TYT5_9BACT|nr:phosphopantothenoylcysteine decarboxylase [Candidatus Scalindua japonica]GAX61018.1 phosphopantothenate/cysteine ligase [Candidatus Scalindua japonica]